MVDYLFFYFIIPLGIFGIFVIFNVACEYRNYSTGHRFVKAFKAHNTIQRIFTKLQMSKDIDLWDMGKITHIGYVGAVISTITAIFVIPFSFISFFLNRGIAIWTFNYWFAGCFMLGTCIFLIQILDSLLNFILELLGK